MKSKFSLVLLVLGLLAIVGIAPAHADTQPLSLAIGLEEALNLGDAEAMTALFTLDGSYVHTVGGDEVIGREAIRDFLAVRSNANRSYEVVGATMNGHSLTLIVDVADSGITWGRQTVHVVVEDGLIQSMELVAFRFLF